MSNHNKCGLCKVEIKNITVADGDDTLIDKISTTLSCGQLTALIGKNGAGKTTLIKAILGERNFSGSISYKDHDGNTHNKPRIGYVPQQLLFDKNSPVSVQDFILACNGKKPVWLKPSKNKTDEISKILLDYGCESIVNRRLGDLSGGELQRLLLAVAVTPMPDMLILDEPVSGVDTPGLDLFYSIVTELRDNYHIPILLVSHDLELIAKYADSVILIDKTILEQGTVREVFSTHSFKSSFGLNFKEVL